MISERFSARTLGGLAAMVLLHYSVLTPAAVGPQAGTAPAAPARGAGTPADVPLAEYAARRKALMRALPDGVTAIRGSEESEFGEVGKFRQNSNFMYLTGVETPGAFLVLSPSAPEGARETLYIPERNPARERWTGPQIGPGEEAARLFGFERVRPTSKLKADVAEALAAGATAKLYSVVPRGEGAEFTREHAFAAELEQTEAAGKKATVADASAAIAELRRIKSDAEVALLKRAIDITGEAQAEVARTVAPGKFEYEVESVILAAYLRNGALRAGFPSIVGSGPFSTILHYNANTRRMEEGDVVVVDIGAEFKYYTADVTRTWPVSGSFTPRQREVYQLVLDTQEAAARHYKPGMNQRDLHKFAVEFMKKSSLRDTAGNTLERYFIHSLGHYLGMDVHDVGDYAPPLRPGDVITLEPGIYISEEQLGVRIEDDYLVTATGLTKLSAAIPSSVEAVERAVRGARARGAGPAQPGR
jgi:Xaa-Pro aminopeptidase